MPKPSPSGLHVAHGIGGGGASIDNVMFSRGAVFGWRDENTVVFANGNDAWMVSLYDVQTRQITRVDYPVPAAVPPVNRPFSRSFKRSPYQLAISANSGYAGGGQFATWYGSPNPAETGLWSSTGFRSNRAGLINMGPDATICYKPEYQSGGPTNLRGLDGTDVLITSGNVDYISMHENGQHLFMEVGQLVPVGIPAPTRAPGGIWKAEAILTGGEWWLCPYYEKHGIVLHPFRTLNEGFSILPRGDGWHAAAVISSDIVRVYIATSEGEQAGQIWVRDIDVVRSTIRDPWGANTWGPIQRVKVLDINKPTDPGNGGGGGGGGVIVPTPQGLNSVQFATLVAERAKIAKTDLTPGEIGAILNATAWKHRNDPGARLGLERKDSGTHAIQPKTGTGIWNGLRIIDKDGNHWGEDVCGSCSVGKFNPTHGTPGKADPTGAKGWVDPVEPDGVTPPPTQTHRYTGGGHDTGICDECSQPRISDIHRVPEGKVKHVPWLGEDGIGDCDLCFQPVSASIHEKDDNGGEPVEYHPFDGTATAKFCAQCGQSRDAAIHQKPPEKPNGGTVDLTETNQILQDILQEQRNTTNAIADLEDTVRAGLKDAAKQLVDALKGGGLIDIFKTGNMSGTSRPDKKKRR